MGINAPPCISSVRAIHLIQKVCDQMEHLINPHAPDPVCQACADCQYGANVKWLGEPRGNEKAKKEESDECFHRPCVARTKQDHYYRSTMDVLNTSLRFALTSILLTVHFDRVHFSEIAPISHISSHKLATACLAGLGFCHHQMGFDMCMFNLCLSVKHHCIFIILHLQLSYTVG